MAKKRKTNIVTAEEKENLARKGSVGRVTSPNTLYMRNAVGDAKAEGITYELTSNFGNHQPIVRSSTTGRWFTLGWEDIIRLAIAAGINDGPARE